MEIQPIVILDFGAQYTQLIARRVRECRVYSELIPHDAPIERIKVYEPKGIILSGGPMSVYVEHAPQLNPEILELGIPVLGICYGMQSLAMALGGTVARTVRLAAPSAVGVPVNSPLSDSVSPAGIVPEATANWYGASPPSAVSVAFAASDTKNVYAGCPE